MHNFTLSLAGLAGFIWASAQRAQRRSAALISIPQSWQWFGSSEFKLPSRLLFIIAIPGPTSNQPESAGWPSLFCEPVALGNTKTLPPALYVLLICLNRT